MKGVGGVGGGLRGGPLTSQSPPGDGVVGLT